MAKRPASPKRQRGRPASAGSAGSVGSPASGRRPPATGGGPPGPPQPEPSGPRREAAGPAGATTAGRVAAASLALTGLIALAYYRVLFLGETFVERDALRFALPSREFLAHALRAGRLPEWLDTVGLGAPFAANPVHEALAPLGWMLALVPGSLGSDLYNLLHLLIAGLGAAALARRLGAGTAGSVIAGAALALGGYATSMVPNNLAPALAWTPWVAWAADRLGCELAGGGQSLAKGPGPPGPVAARAAVRRRRLASAAVLAAALALQLLAGEPGSVLIAGLTALIVLMARAGRRPRAINAIGAVGALAASAAAALPLAAVALLPALLLLRESARGAGLDQGGLEWSLLPGRLIETIWPAAFGSQRVDGWLAGLVLRDGPGDPCWSFSLFLGLPVLLCAWAAARQRPVRRLLLSSAVFLLLAVGPLLPIYTILRELFPPLRWVNFPEKFVYGALLLWSAAAGAGFSRLLPEGAEGAKGGEGAEGASRRLRLAAWVGTALLALGVALLALWRTDAAATLARRAATWGVLVDAEAGLGAALVGGCVAAGAAGLFALALSLLGLPGRRWPHGGAGGALGSRRGPSPGGVLSAGRVLSAHGGLGAIGILGLALLAALGPLVWTAATTTPLAHRSVIASTPAVLRGIVPPSRESSEVSPSPGSLSSPGPSASPGGPPARSLPPRLFRLDPRRENGPFHDGDEIARDYHESLDTNIASRFGFDVLPGFEPGESTRFLRFGREVFPHLSATAFTRLLGIEWLVVRDPAALGLPFPVVATGEGGSALLAAGAVRPRAFVAPRWRAAATPEQALAALADAGREDDPGLITLVDPDPGKLLAQAPLSPCRARQPRPEEVMLDCDSPAGGYAVLLDEWAPGWSAAADGHPTPILLADGLFRAVAVGPGPHRIVLRYRTPGLRAGAAVSLLAWLAVAAWSLTTRDRSKAPARRVAGENPQP